MDETPRAGRRLLRFALLGAAVAALAGTGMAIAQGSDTTPSSQLQGDKSTIVMHLRPAANHQAHVLDASLSSVQAGVVASHHPARAETLSGVHHSSSHPTSAPHHAAPAPTQHAIGPAAIDDGDLAEPAETEEADDQGDDDQGEDADDQGDDDQGENADDQGEQEDDQGEVDD